MSETAPKADQNQLASHLARLIAAGGPITVARYMAEALNHPRWGYYQQREPFGRAGDFTTAPEISQMFGEMLGFWCIDQWRAMGRPTPVSLVELGPGRGTLMVDLLRVTAVDPDFRAALKLHLVETSLRLRDFQRDRISAAPETRWHDRLDTVPEGPSIFLANELFDALPIHQFVSTKDGWRERLIGCDAEGALRFILAPTRTPALALLGRLGVPDSTPPGSIAEVAPEALTLATEIGRRVSRHPGAALIVDFARDAPFGDSLQAVRGHRRHDVLATPGEADLAAKVDFAALGAAAGHAGAAVRGPVGQGVFLKALGIAVRAARLSASASASQANAIDAALKRLTDPQEMGDLFQMLALTSPAHSIPPGFQTCGDRI